MGAPCIQKLRTGEVLVAVKVVACCCQAVTATPEATEMVADWNVEVPKVTFQYAVMA